MRDEEEVREKFDQLRSIRLKKRREYFLTRNCENCVFSNKVHLKGKGKINLCSNETVKSRLGREIFVCDDDIAKKCYTYECRRTESEIDEEFLEIISSPSRCGDKYPKLAMLIWFLQGNFKSSKKDRLIDAIKSFKRSLAHLFLLRWW